MKKLAVLFGAALAAMVSGADTVTNYVVVVSNIYNRISEEKWVTNNVKNTHANYYYTNNVYTIDHQTLVVEKTNLTVNADVSQEAIAAARAQANRAEDAVESARGYASTAAGSASSAAGSASSASSYANQAASQRSAAASECAAALGNINARIAWFDEHAGETITVVNVTTNYYVYNADKLIARGGNIHGVHRYVLYINGVKYPDYWVEIDFSQYSAAASGGQCWAYTVWRQSQKNNTSNHSYVYNRIMHASYPGGLIRDERSAYNKFTMLTTNGGYSQGYYYQGSLTNSRDAYPSRVLTHYKYAGYEYRIDDDPYWDVNADLRITDVETGAVIDKVSRMSDLNALSNWVEQVFQKK